jgi:hypothetical protein
MFIGQSLGIIDVSSSNVMRARLFSVERLGSSFFKVGLTPALVGYELPWSSELFFAYILRSDGIEATLSKGSISRVLSSGS